MAQITTAALQPRDTKVFVGGITPINHSFSPTVISATVTNGDRILIATLPANSKIIGGSMRLTGTSGATAIAHLQVVGPTGDAISLSPTTGAPAAPSVALSTLMTLPHSPVSSVTGTRSLEIVCVSGSISVTNGMVWYVDAQYQYYP